MCETVALFVSFCSLMKSDEVVRCFLLLVFYIIFKIHCESHSLWRLDDHVSCPAMIGLDYCLAVSFNVIFC